MTIDFRLAYNWSEYLDERIVIMSAWSDYLGKASPKVVSIGKGEYG